MDVEQKLKEIYQLRLLQNDVLHFRRHNEVQNGDVLKQALKKDLQNLINADITLVQTNIKLPDPSAVPPTFVENLEPVSRTLNLETLLIDEKNTMEALEMFK